MLKLVKKWFLVNNSKSQGDLHAFGLRHLPKLTSKSFGLNLITTNRAADTVYTTILPNFFLIFPNFQNLRQTNIASGDKNFFWILEFWNFFICSTVEWGRFGFDVLEFCDGLGGVMSSVYKYLKQIWAIRLREICNN